MPVGSPERRQQDKESQELLTIIGAAGTFSPVSENSWLSAVRFGADGLVPVVAQESRSGDVLMLAFANREALERSASTGQAHYYSRSRAALWRKGETSGHVQQIREIRIDCDGDTVLYRVEQTGPACHHGTRTCFSTTVDSTGLASAGEDPGGHLLARLAATIARRAEERPQGSYTAKLLDGGVPKISQKLGEEAVEVVVAANSEDDERLASEAADLLYHLLVLLRARGVPLDAVWKELEHRSR
jgi:phosphoribosyl-ATP pyrophosphohydrolase/phosphoribosyl-AMP cyclohydrolase